MFVLLQDGRVRRTSLVCVLGVLFFFLSNLYQLLSIVYNQLVKQKGQDGSNVVALRCRKEMKTKTAKPKYSGIEWKGKKDQKPKAEYYSGRGRSMYSLSSGSS